MNVTEKLKEIFDAIPVSQETEQIRSYYAQTYGPDVLQSLSDDMLAERLFADAAAGNELGARGLFCCLEFGDRRVPKEHFGSGKEGAGQTGVLMRSNGNGGWSYFFYPNGDKKQNISRERAIEFAKETRAVICDIYRVLQREPLSDLAGYERADREIGSICRRSRSPYVAGSDLKVKLLKYFHIFFPDKVMEFYTEGFLGRVLDLFDSEIFGGGSRFLRQGRIALYAKAHGMGDGVRFAQAVYRLLGQQEEERPSLQDMSAAENAGVTDIDKNLILYGPPGTGKTYSTVLYAVGIIEGKKESELANYGDYKAVKAKFDEYRKKGRIEFVTFHQSYGYEEFIQGIKPTAENGQVVYRVEDGVFKKFCDGARSIVRGEADNYGFNKNPTVWKVSLDGAGWKGNRVHRECLDTDCIRIGWDEYGDDLSGESEFKYGGRDILNRFIDELEIGDIVLSCWSQTQIDAIGVVTGEYEWLSDERQYPHLRRRRSVKWLRKWSGAEKQDILELNGGKKLMQGTLYRTAISAEDIVPLLDPRAASEKIVYDYSEPRVFIIDEINRGNISKIFGELITLIETGKRLGEDEETVCKLPYGDEKPFGVPKNVWILGTMNTADRSLVQLDAALRRRFSFREMMPEYSLLDFTVGRVHIGRMLEAINGRISEYLDREHQIGHSYFLGLKGSGTVRELARVFERNILPLLQEYFFGDCEKIEKILPVGFADRQGLKASLQEDDYVGLYGNP